jgi:S1-C subfamily serine protease
MLMRAALSLLSAAPAQAFISPVARSSFTALSNLPRCGCIAPAQHGRASVVMQRSEEQPLWQQAGAAVAIAAASILATNAGLFSGLGLGPNNAQLQTQQATQSSTPREVPSFAGAGKPLADLAREENSYIKIFEQVTRACMFFGHAACHVAACAKSSELLCASLDSDSWYQQRVACQAQHRTQPNVLLHCLHCCCHELQSTPGVVYISTFVNQRDAFSMNIMEVPAGTGTGFVWDKQGHIVTNFHVIRSANTAQIRLTDAKTGKQATYSARVQGYDPDKDVSVFTARTVSLLFKLLDGTTFHIGTRATVAQCW